MDGNEPKQSRQDYEQGRKRAADGVVRFEVRRGGAEPIEDGEALARARQVPNGENNCRLVDE